MMDRGKKKMTLIVHEHGTLMVPADNDLGFYEIMCGALGAQTAFTEALPEYVTGSGARAKYMLLAMLRAQAAGTMDSLGLRPGERARLERDAAELVRELNFRFTGAEVQSDD